MMLPARGSPVIVQGITGKYGSLHSQLMRDYGTNVAAGVTPGKGGETVGGVPVYDTMPEAVSATGAKSSILFVPAPQLYSAAEEAVLAGVRLLVVITERVPIRDEIRLVWLARAHGATVVGPNSPGLIIPSEGVKLGIMPATSFRTGTVALFSRSGTLMYEIADQLSSRGYGQAIAVGVGGDPINGTPMVEFFDLVSDRPDVDAVVAVGEIGGDSEERLATYIRETKFPKPVLAYVAGRAAPHEKRMGHAGAIIYGSYGTAQSKIEAFREAGVGVAMTPSGIPDLLSTLIGR
jgi:succinyl-CoA synthetase alpha subunit